MPRNRKLHATRKRSYNVSDHFTIAVLARLSVDRPARAPVRVDPKLEVQGQGYRSQTKYPGLGFFSGVVVSARSILSSSCLDQQSSALSRTLTKRSPSSAPLRRPSTMPWPPCATPGSTEFLRSRTFRSRLMLRATRAATGKHLLVAEKADCRRFDLSRH